MNKTITSVLVGLMLFSGVASAQTTDLPSPGTTPGSPFFFLDRFFEGIGNVFTFGQASKARRAVAIAEERLSEARVLATRGDENAQEAVELYEEKVTEAVERAQNAQNVDALARVTEAISKHFAVLEDVIGRVPEQAKASVQRALESSRQGQVSALQALAGEDPSKAVEVGANAAKAHLERAKTNAAKRDNAGVEKAIADFETLRNIADNAQRGQAVLAAQYSRKLNEVVAGIDDVEEASANLPASVKNRIEQAKTRTIDSQLSSLRELVREDSRKAIEIFAAGADARLNAAKENAEKRNSESTKNTLEEYEKYAKFGEEISTTAGGIRTGETTVGDLVKKATSQHLQVLEDVRQKLPSQAQQEFQRAIDSAKKVQELRPAIPAPAQPGVQPQQQPAQPRVPQQIPVTPPTQQQIQPDTQQQLPAPTIPQAPGRRP